MVIHNNVDNKKLLLRKQLIFNALNGVIVQRRSLYNGNQTAAFTIVSLLRFVMLY